MARTVFSGLQDNMSWGTREPVAGVLASAVQRKNPLLDERVHAWSSGNFESKLVLVILGGREPGGTIGSAWVQHPQENPLYPLQQCSIQERSQKIQL